MPAFRFKLQPVLEQRRRTERDRQRELAELLTRKRELEAQLRTEQQTIHDDKAAMADRLVGRVDVSRIRQHASHVGQVTIRARRAAGELMTLHQRIEGARSSLLEATRARRAVELLRDRQYRRWLAEEQRREAAEQDELAMQSYGRRKQEVRA